MNQKELWLYLQGKTNKRDAIDELEARGEITALTAFYAHDYLDDIANEECKRRRVGEIY